MCLGHLDLRVSVSQLVVFASTLYSFSPGFWEYRGVGAPLPTETLHGHGEQTTVHSRNPKLTAGAVQELPVWKLSFQNMAKF